MSFLLDTNVLSDLIKPKPNESLEVWLKGVPSSSLYISVLTLGEIRRGVEKMDGGQKKVKLLSWLEYDLPQWFGDRVIPIDGAVADKWGYLTAQGSLQKVPAIDSLLAATALTHNLKMVTRNVKDFHFLGLELVNPFK